MQVLRKGGKMKKRNIWFVSAVFLIENIFFIPKKAEASLNIKDLLAEIGFYASIGGTILGSIAGIYKIIRTCCVTCCIKKNINNTLSDSEEPETQYTNSNWNDTYTDQNDTENNTSLKLSKNKNSSSSRFTRSNTTIPISKITIFNEI